MTDKVDRNAPGYWKEYYKNNRDKYKVYNERVTLRRERGELPPITVAPISNATRIKQNAKRLEKYYENHEANKVLRREFQKAHYMADAKEKKRLYYINVVKPRKEAGKKMKQ